MKLALPQASIRVTRWRRFRANVDWPLMVVVFAIAGIGLLNLYSGVHGTHNAPKFDRQVTWIGVGAVAFFAALATDYRTLVRMAWIGLAGAVLLLVIVHLLGDAAGVKGGYRWLLGQQGGQPSEPTKVAVILLLAKILGDGDLSRYKWQQLLVGGIAILTPIAMVAVQPDLGTATLLVLIILSVGFIALPKVGPAVWVTLAFLAMIPLRWDHMHAYQKDRILSFIDPSADPTGLGWHTRQSILAVGSGQVTGKGWMEGTQNQFDFLPEHWTDFPFAGWAEEWGFLGSGFLLGLYAFLLMWILNVALSARDRAGAIVCVGVGAMTFWHMVVNIAMVLGLAPVVGVTLPMISYGGSSLLTFFVGLGLVASVSLRRHGY